MPEDGLAMWNCPEDLDMEETFNDFIIGAADMLETNPRVNETVQMDAYFLESLADLDTINFSH